MFMSITILKQTEISAAISKVASQARDTQTAIHQIAYSVLDHTREFGDFTGAERLLNALPSGQRVKSLGQWFDVMSSGKLRLSQDPKTKLWKGELAKDRSDADFLMAKAEGLDYGDFKPEIVSKVIDLKAFLKKVEKVSTDDSMVKDKQGREVPAVTAETRAIAAKAVAFLRALPEVQAAVK